MNEFSKRKKKCCRKCSHYVFAITMEGYHGFCETKGVPVRYDEKCELFERKEKTNNTNE